MFNLILEGDFSHIVLRNQIGDILFQSVLQCEMVFNGKNFLPEQE